MANPYASKAGYDILARVAAISIDAMVTVQLILGLVEPQSSGIATGGGAQILLYYGKKDDILRTYDGRETAPQNASESLFR